MVAAFFWYSEDGAICLSMHCIHESVYLLPVAFTAALCREIAFYQHCLTRPGVPVTNIRTFYINLLAFLKTNKQTYTTQSCGMWQINRSHYAFEGKRLSSLSYRLNGVWFTITEINIKHKAPAAETQAVKICAQSVSQIQTERNHNRHGETETFKLAVWSRLVLLLRCAPLH